MRRPRRTPFRELIDLRLAAQRLAGARFPRVADAVAWFGAVQAQDYPGAQWGIGQRVQGATAADVERAIAAREIVRTWPMRGTLHVLAAADVHWMTRLLAPRVIQRAAGRHRQLGLDARTVRRARDVRTRALAGGAALTRPEAYATLAAAKIPPTGQRGIHILGVLAMQGALCFGPHRGKQPTFVLLDEWVAAPADRDRDDALGELARRYFTSHGPATIADLAWWSGLPLGDAKRAHDIAFAARTLESFQFAERGYWAGVGAAPAPRTRGTTIHLLPAYDEYTVAYRDRFQIVEYAHVRATQNGLSPVVLADGRVAGTWTRAIRPDRVIVDADLLWKLPRGPLAAAAGRFGTFHGRRGALL